MMRENQILFGTLWLLLLEKPDFVVFLGDEVLGTSLAGARMPLSICLKSLSKLNVQSLASQHRVMGTKYINLWPLLATKAKTD